MRPGSLLVVLAAVFVPVLAGGEDDGAGWFDRAVKAGAIDGRLQRARAKEIVDALNVARAEFAGLPPVTWDVARSEPHSRHARWLLHHMREPWNSGGVADPHSQVPGSHLYDAAASAAAQRSVIAFKYIRQDGSFDPTERWVPTIGHRLPWLMRSAAQVCVGYAEGTVPQGEEFAGWKWGVVVLEADRTFGGPVATADPRDVEPVVCPRDGARNVPPLLGREVPEHVPPELDRDLAGAQRKLGFPITFSFFGGDAIGTDIEASLVRLGSVEPPEGDAERGRGKRKRRTRRSAADKDTPAEEPTPVEVHLSAPRVRPLRGRSDWNLNSIVLIPVAPLDPATRYRARVKVRTAVDSQHARDVELVTTFETGQAAK